MTDTPASNTPGTQPALILLYGSGTAVQRRRPLDRDAVILGRSRGCDLVLEAPDVSSPHCVITRGTAGYSVRDCGSRAGTRLNGEPVHQAQLLDGDLLQVGPFSFRLSLPVIKQEALKAARESRLAQLERKRRNLTRVALAQRRLIKQLRQAGKAAPPGPDLSAQAEALQERIRTYELRLFRLEQAERDLSRDREVFEQDQKAFEAQMLQAENELARQRAQLTAEAELRGAARLSSAGVS